MCHHRGGAVGGDIDIVGFDHAWHEAVDSTRPHVDELDLIGLGVGAEAIEVDQAVVVDDNRARVADPLQEDGREGERLAEADVADAADLGVGVEIDDDQLSVHGGGDHREITRGHDDHSTGRITDGHDGADGAGVEIDDGGVIGVHERGDSRVAIGRDCDGDGRAGKIDAAEEAKRGGIPDDEVARLAVSDDKRRAIGREGDGVGAITLDGAAAEDEVGVHLVGRRVEGVGHGEGLVGRRADDELVTDVAIGRIDKLTEREGAGQTGGKTADSDEEAEALHGVDLSLATCG